VVSVLFGTVGLFFGDDTVRVKKRLLGCGNRNMVFAWFSLSFSSSHSKEAFFTDIVYQIPGLWAIQKYGE
jgi:xanthosine utilization system XapX-like protein